MALIAKNINDGSQLLLDRKPGSKASHLCSFSNKYLTANNINDTVSLSSKHKFSGKKVSYKQNISFKGGKTSVLKLFWKGETAVPGDKLFKDIAKYISPKGENLVHVLEYNVYHPKFGIANEMIRTTEPFLKNLGNAFASLPRVIGRAAIKIFGGKNAKKELEMKLKKENTRNRLLGLWMNVTKYADDFEKALTGEKNVSELKNITSNGIKGKEKELSEFFEKRKLNALYSFHDGKEAGFLAKSDEQGHHLEGFIEEILGKTPAKAENSFKENAKKSYVQKIIDQKIIDKQGSVLPNYGQSGASFVARVVSGIIPAWFIAHDFYNLIMLNSDNKKEAKKEWQSKFKQESLRVGIEAYQGFIINYVFEKITNKSLLSAVGLNIVNIIGANTFSRMFTGRPVLPVSMEKASKLNQMQNKKAENINNSPVVASYYNSDGNDEKIKQFEVYKSFKKPNPAIGFGANNTGILNSIKAGIKKFDTAFANKCPSKINLEKFVQSYERVKTLDEKDAKKMLEIVAEQMGMDKVKTTIEELKKTGQKEITTGKNWIYRYSKSALNVLRFPFDFTAMLVKGAIINPVRKLFGKEPLKAKKGSSFYSEQFIKNVTKWADNVYEKMGTVDHNNIEEARGRYADKKNFFSTKVMEYGADQLSTAMKFTGFASVPFLAIDAYNVTLGKTKNTEKANEKTKERAVQDSARQGISLWICYAFNNMGKVILNSSLLGSAAVIAAQTFTYESLTRLSVGQPLLPTTHKKMVEAEERKAKSNNKFSKLMAGRLKTNRSIDLTENSNDSRDKAVIPPINTIHSFNMNSESKEISDLYKSFARSRN